MQFLERLRQLFFYAFKKNAKDKEKSLVLRQNEYDKRRIGEILVFEIYTIPRRIGLRGVQSEQIQANSSFFRAVAKFLNI